MIADLTIFESREPEIVLKWRDRESEAKGWLVINSLRGGAAGGGTRMKKGIDLQEVILLAKTMEIKFTVSGPKIGGAKSGIDFDPFDPRKEDVLRRWYKAILPMLKNCYGTGGDLNVDFIHEVIPFTKEWGILHPQEGILAGHFKGINVVGKAVLLSNGASRIVREDKYSPDPRCEYTIADLISGYSVAESVVHYYRIFQDTHIGKRAIVQGWGNVGASAGYYLAQSGVKVVSILDQYGGVINENGFDFNEIRQFYLERKSRKFSRYPLIPYADIMEKFWNIPADIFVPAAASRLVTKEQVEAMIRSGVGLIACGANVPFADKENFFGPNAEFADNRISVIPDFIANCGMARVFAYLMEDEAIVSDEAIFQDVSETVNSALLKACEGGRSATQTTQRAYQNALRELIFTVIS